MKAIWKGSISFGLVNIPIKMYVGSYEREFKFVLLHEKDLSEVRYARMCKAEEKEIPWKEIVKGYEYKKGEFLIFTEEELKNIHSGKKNSIEIISFASESEVDSVYYSKPYFLEPEKNAKGAYALLKEALKKSKKVGVAKFVIHNREHIAIIKPYKNTIILNQLRYQDEIVEGDLNIAEKERISSRELEIALKLIDQITEPFDLKKFKDTYNADLKNLIDKKAKGKKVKIKKEEKAPSKLHDMMSLLKASLDTPKKKKKQKVA